MLHITKSYVRTLLLGVVAFSFFVAGTMFAADEKTYATENSRLKKSAGNAIYYIDPERGNDTNSGRGETRPWKTFLPLSSMRLTAGDTVVVAPGRHEFSLLVNNGEGTEKLPITIRFLSGKHVFAHGKLWAEKYHISNTNDCPDAPKAVAVRLKNTKNVRLVGAAGAEILAEGKMIYAVIDDCRNVSLDGLTFDYLHPTVCELRIVGRTEKFIDAKIDTAFQYEIRDGRLFWKGPGWSFPLGGFIKVFNPDTGTFGGNFSPDGARAEELAPGNVRFSYAGTAPQTRVGQVIQNRDITRDCVGFFQRRSRNIRWENCSIHTIHGMGVVSQFCEDLSFSRLTAAPRKKSSRTNVAWADILHFSGCKGKIRVADSVLSSSHDDAINVHGTHLRVAERVNNRTLILRFMHNQTFGIDGFFPGDEVEFVHGKSLQPFGTNIVEKVRALDARRLEVVFKKNVPQKFEAEDAVENVTWTPSLHVNNVVVRNIPTRGFLVTTRRLVVIENCRFERTGMSAILVEDDASGWFESGPVRDMIIRKNKFVECATPVVNINPHVLSGNGTVHENIRIERNLFRMKGGVAIASHHSKNVSERDNKFEGTDKKNAVSIR